MIRQFGSQKVSADFVIKDRLGGDITCNSGIGAMRRSKPPELVLYEIKRGETGSTPLPPPLPPGGLCQHLYMYDFVTMLDYRPIMFLNQIINTTMI